jgi:hypothetical protein
MFELVGDPGPKLGGVRASAPSVMVERREQKLAVDASDLVRLNHEHALAHATPHSADGCDRRHTPLDFRVTDPNAVMQQLSEYSGLAAKAQELPVEGA